METKSMYVADLVTGFTIFAIIIAVSLLTGCGQEPVAVDTPTATVAVRPLPPPPVLEEPAPVVVPEPRVVSYEEAEAAFNNRDFREAADLFAVYTEQHPGNPWGHFMHGLSARRAGDLVVAERALTAALEQDSAHVKSWINLARVRLDDSRPAEAITAIERAVAIDGPSADSYRLTGRSFHQINQLPEAADAYRDAIYLDEADAWSMNNLGLVQIEDGLHADALPTLARAVQLRDDVAIFQNNLGMALELSRRFRMAEAAYSKALELNPDYGKADTNLARVASAEQDATIVDADLDALAQQFIDEIASWSDESVAWETDTGENSAVAPGIVDLTGLIGFVAGTANATGHITDH